MFVTGEAEVMEEADTVTDVSRFNQLLPAGFRPVALKLDTVGEFGLGGFGRQLLGCESHSFRGNIQLRAATITRVFE